MLMLIVPLRSPGTTNDVQAAPSWPNVDTQLHQTRQDSSLDLFLDTMEMEGKIWSGNMIQVLMTYLLHMQWHYSPVHSMELA